MNLVSGELIAIKVLSVSDGDQAELDEIKKEISIMQELSHPNIVQYLGAELYQVCLKPPFRLTSHVCVRAPLVFCSLAALLI